MKNISILIAFILLVNSMAFAQTTAPEKIQKDSLQLGRASTGANKNITFDTGDGGSNKKIELNGTSKEFTLNSTTNVTGNVVPSGNVTATGSVSGSSVSTTGALSVDGTSTHKLGTTLGSGTNASKQITVDRAGFDPFIKWNETAGKWTFSNDGSVEKNFGSGSGGDTGITVLLNGSLEDGIAVDWASSGGTFSSQTYATPDPSGNDTVFARFISTTSGQYFETVAHAIPSNVIGGCLAKINYNTTNTSTWKLQVYDGSSNLLKEVTLDAKTWQDGHAPFPCPTVGTTVKMRVISLGAGQIEADKGYLGKENRTFRVQTIKTGSVTTPGTSLCIWSNVGTSAYTSVTDTDCPVATTSGIALAPAIKTPAIKLPAGTGPIIDFRVNGYFRGDRAANTNSGCAWDLYDGTNSYPLNWTVVGGASGSIAATTSALGTRVNLSSPLSVDTTYTLRIYANSATTTCSISNDDPALNTFQIAVTSYPSESQTALTPEAQDWIIDANIGGGDPGLGAANVASYSEVTVGTLDMSLKSGSASARIPCSGTNPATGLTCSAGVESVGVNFTPPQPGYYEACFDFSQMSNQTAATIAHYTFQVVETSNASQTILQEGGSRMSNSFNATSTAIQQAYTQHNCGTFYFASATERTLRLMYEMSVSGTINFSQITASRPTSYGQADIHVVVRPTLSPYNRPYLTGDQVISPGATNPVSYSFFIAPTTGTVTNIMGDIGAASCTVNASNFTCSVPGKFSVTPACHVDEDNISAGQVFAKYYRSGSTSSSIVINFTASTNGAAATPLGTTVTCHGVK